MSDNKHQDNEAYRSASETYRQAGEVHREAGETHREKAEDKRESGEARRIDGEIGRMVADAGRFTVDNYHQDMLAINEKLDTKASRGLLFKVAAAIIAVVLANGLWGVVVDRNTASVKSAFDSHVAVQLESDAGVKDKLDILKKANDSQFTNQTTIIKNQEAILELLRKGK